MSCSEELRRQIESPQLTLLQCINLLRENGSNIGVQHALVKKLNFYSYDELEFYIPQFVQLLVTSETDSMALEEFLLEYCFDYPHFSLIVFWVLQAFLFELRNEPTSYAFQIVRNFINNLQSVLFNVEDLNLKRSEFRENLQPSLVLCGAIASSFALPTINEYVTPIIKSQAKQQKSFVFKLANFQKNLTKNLTMKNQKISNQINNSTNEEEFLSLSREMKSLGPSKTDRKYAVIVSPDDSDVYTTDDDDQRSLSRNGSLKEAAFAEVGANLKVNTVIKSNKSRSKNPNSVSSPLNILKTKQLNRSSQSLPDLSHNWSRPDLTATESEMSLQILRNSTETHSKKKNSSDAKSKSFPELLKILRVNYSKKETEFIMSLQDISLRMSSVPKAARVSALRAELSIINDTLLPSEIDIPQLLPVTSKKNKKFHQILKLNINEACVLNSAERVPYLLLIEYLSDELDFNPFTEYNQNLINSRLQAADRKRSNEYNQGDNESVSSDMQGIPVMENLTEVLVDETDLGELPILGSRSISRDWTQIRTEGNSRRSSQDDDKTNRIVSPIISGSADTSVLADQMRIASLMLQQLQNNGQSNTQQFISIKNRIVDSMISLQDQFEAIDYEKMKELKTDEQDAGQRKMENDFKISEDWNEKKQRIRKASAFGHLKNWDLCSVIVKNGDDLPQESFACQLITMISNIWKKHGVRFWTKKMRILITSANAGLVETITNSMSIHSIKKSLTELSIASGQNAKGRIFTLKDYFEKLFGEVGSRRYKLAQENFAKSLAAYSIICYVLQIKDRHNGNIMLDNEGHIIHIDFGFLLGNSPGSNIGFEAVPFKLTSEYIDLLGGVESEFYKLFVQVCKDCFKVLRKESDQIVSIVKLMQKDSNIPCFNNGENTSVLLQQRLQLQMSDDLIDQFVEVSLINKSLNSVYTRLYDQFQMITQGIYN
ncbi:pik1 [Candida pseudojiufengensis]|uniref:pik1 n=1 Tax=Candida pseudojiufengensis TaxID=497109 RepID=UPI002225A28C|nr:pik1 [Candida pseudojiufengensis]KAI5964169.1 pik1 [Candida pseudojiufengensis]